MPRYAVIGAGAAGVSAFQQLRDAGLHVECFEKTDRVGGHWHTDYDALHLITSRDATHFEGFPMPAEYPHFPSRDQVRAYIESYAEHHGHGGLIRFTTEVTSVRPVPAGDQPAGSAGWRVETSRGDEGVFDGVVVANGHLWDAHVPEVDGEFTGYQAHSSSYHNVRELPGDRVLVVGAGNSGCDLAVDAAQHRLAVDIVMTKGIHFQSKRYFGRPRGELSFLSGFTPEDQDTIFRLFSRLSLGDSRDYPGMPAPEAKTLAEGATTVNDLLLYWIHHGRVRIRPGIVRFDGDTVHFADGASAGYDAVLWATGFNVRLPFLDDDVITWRDRVPVRYAGGILPERAEKLYFAGLIAPRGPQIPIYGTQTKMIVRMIELHNSAGPGGLALSRYFARMQEPELRVDVVRDAWLEQMADTERLLAALDASSEVTARDRGNA